ncbi:MAG: NAD-dependent protein deacetylase [Pseudomonadota bacterium]
MDVLQTRANASTEETPVCAIVDSLPALVLTGAGISVSSGIPTYRNDRGEWLRSDPITHQEFLSQERQRKRYWGRSLLGWPAVRDAAPGIAHSALAELEKLQAISHLVTQNVDRLHQKAGSESVTDLHGRLDNVKCRSCDAQYHRDDIQTALAEANPHINRTTVDARPDGDADMSDELVDSIRIPDCQRCGGVLMPDVVFFGGSIPRDRVAYCRSQLKTANSLIVIGSSLQVYSGFRFCRWASQESKPIFLINPGTTRADDLGRRWATDADSALLAVLSRLRQA